MIYQANGMRIMLLFSLFASAAQGMDLQKQKVMLKSALRNEDVVNRFIDSLVQRSRAAVEAQPICENLKVCLNSGMSTQNWAENGAELLRMAAIQGYADACELLIKHGVDRERADVNGETPLMHAAPCGKKNVVRVLLTTIPSQGSELIQQCMVGLVALRRVTFELNPIVYKLVAQKLIDLLVADQMPRIENLLAAKLKWVDGTGKTAREVTVMGSNDIWASENKRKTLNEIARMLDLSDAESCRMLKMQLAANIKRILFGEPETTIIRRRNQWYHGSK